MVRLPSGVRYWTVLDEDLAVVPVADGFLRQVRFGRDGAESTTKSYAGAIALFLRWCARTGRDWQAGAAQLGLFMTWLAHAGPGVSGIDARPGAAVLAGPGSAPARSARRVNGVRSGLRHPQRLTVLAIASEAWSAVFWVLRTARAVQRRKPRIAAGSALIVAGWVARLRAASAEPLR